MVQLLSACWWDLAHAWEWGHWYSELYFFCKCILLPPHLRHIEAVHMEAACPYTQNDMASVKITKFVHGLEILSN